MLSHGLPEDLDERVASLLRPDLSPSRLSALAELIEYTAEPCLAEPAERLIRSLIEQVEGRAAVEALARLIEAIDSLASLAAVVFSISRAHLHPSPRCGHQAGSLPLAGAR